MRVHTRTEGGCTGQSPGRGRPAYEAGAPCSTGQGRQGPEAGPSPGQRRRDVTADVAPLVEATGEVAAG